MKQYTHREFVRILEKNGFLYSRHRGGHAIYVNDRGKHISVPRKVESVIARRLIIENNLNTDVK